MEAMLSSETLLDTQTTRRSILEDGIIYDYRFDNLKSYKKGKVVKFSTIKAI
jgi:hypothetical protein